MRWFCQNSYLFNIGLNAENPTEFDPFICLTLLVGCDSRFGEEDDDIEESSILNVEPPRSLLLSLSESASGPEEIYSGNTLQRNVFDLDIDPFERRFSLISDPKL